MWKKGWEDISKVFSGLPEAQAGGNMYPYEGGRGKMVEEMEKEVVIEIKQSENFQGGGSGESWGRAGKRG